MAPPSKHTRPPDEVGEEDLERPVLRPRTTAPDVDALPVDGLVVVLNDQVEERGRRRDSWDSVKRRLRIRSPSGSLFRPSPGRARLPAAWRVHPAESSSVEHVVACAVEDFAARSNHARHRPSRASSLPPRKLGRGPGRAETEGGAGGTLGAHSSRSG
jgi:hypothetical protein